MQLQFSELIFIAFLASAISLDITAIGQFMISRPIVVGPIFGAIFNDLKSGLWIGMIIELLWIRVIPMGASIPYGITAISILTVLWGTSVETSQQGIFVLALLIAVPFGVLFKLTNTWARYFNVYISRWVEKSVKNGKEYAVTCGVVLGILTFFIQMFLFYLVLINPGRLVVSIIFNKISSEILNGLNIAWFVLPLAGFSVLAVNFNYKILRTKLTK